MEINIFNGKADLQSINYSRYANGALAVVANVDFGEGYAEPMKMSVNLADDQPITSDQLAVGEFHCPAYSEHEATFKALLEADLIEVVGGPHPSGYVMIDVCKLTAKGQGLVVNPEELADVAEFRKHLGL